MRVTVTGWLLPVKPHRIDSMSQDRFADPGLLGLTEPGEVLLDGRRRG